MDSVFNSDLGISVHNGFPNAADDNRLQPLSLDQLLVTQPHSTYFFRIAGKQWQGIGIFDGDIAIIDRSLTPHANNLVVWWHDDTFAISHRHAVPTGASVWGTVTTTIHQWVVHDTPRHHQGGRHARAR